jgi:polysaccharide export outer membrane protein
MNPHRSLIPVSTPMATLVVIFALITCASAAAPVDLHSPSASTPGSPGPVAAGAEPAPGVARPRVTVAQSTAVTTTPDATRAAPNAAPTSEEEYRIGPEDVLQIAVWKNEAVNRTVAVRPDGKISLPLLNDVMAAGLTPMEFRDVLVNKLTEYMPNPEVSVIVVEPRSFKISILGEVPKPGRLELKARTTVLDAIALAGGLGPFASRRSIVVLRPDGNGATRRIPFNYNKALSAGGEQENFYLRPGDIVLVP